MNEKRAVEKTMLTQAYNGQKPGSPMEWGEAGIRASLKARRARARSPGSPDEAARNHLEAHIALRDAANALKARWKPYSQRKGVKLSTKSNYDSVLQLHVLPAFGDLRMEEIVPLHVERFVPTKLTSGLSAKTLRNLLLVLQAILSLAVDNDLIARSPIRKRHKPTVDRHEKPICSLAVQKQYQYLRGPQQRWLVQLRLFVRPSLLLRRQRQWGGEARENLKVGQTALPEKRSSRIVTLNRRRPVPRR